jgi:predicted O-linked N-acetylglucosamine transferase (SPINDLY family)
MNDTLFRTAHSQYLAGNLAEAERLCSEALRVNPDHVDTLYLLGFMFFERGQFDDALRLYDHALAIAPRGEIYAARGAVLSQLGRHADALAAYDRAVALRPELFGAWTNRGNALLELAQLQDALASYDTAIAVKPDYADAWRNRATALTDLGRRQEALESLDRALQLRPDFGDAMEDRGHLLISLNRHADAVAAYDRALALKPANANLLYSRGNALLILKRSEEAIRDCEAVLALNANYPYARGVLLHCKLQSCDWLDIGVHKAKMSEAIAHKQREVSPFSHKALSDSPGEQLRCAQIWMAAECPPAPEPVWQGERYQHDKIRLAYVSADFGTTAVGSIFAGVFEHHDKSRFETIALSTGPQNRTPLRVRLEKAFTNFIDVSDRGDTDIAALMRRMEIDIAVDLMGFTGACRTRIFAQRPCPIQVNYLGFPGTMGAEYIDYIIADGTVIPQAQRPFYVEKVAYLPHSYLPFDSANGIAGATPTRAEAGLPEGAFVFCSFNSSYKFAPEMFDVWTRLLRAVESSVLWLPENNPSAMRNLSDAAAARGVARERLIFAPFLESQAKHLARLTLADLFLDTLPFNAHSIAADALGSGLPLLTCPGEAFAGRVGASVLRAAGLHELIADSLAAYEAMALKLARDPALLATIRDKLARNRGNSPLFDTARFTRHLETAFTQMYDRHRHDRPPADFSVPAEDA